MWRWDDLERREKKNSAEFLWYDDSLISGLSSIEPYTVGVMGLRYFEVDVHDARDTNSLRITVCLYGANL